MSSPTTNRPGIHDRITSSVLAELVKGTAPWRKPWDGVAGLPMNQDSGRRYSGINTILIWLHQLTNGLSDNRYLTANQIIKQGGSFKGAKAARILFYKPVTKTKDNNEEKDDSYMIAKGYNVFSVEQVTGLNLEPLTPTDFAQKHQEFNDLLNTAGAKIRHFGASAHYTPTSDTITMPPKHVFDSAEAYFATLAHELVHWTGHHTRLNRNEHDQRPTPTEYAFEELVAELGAAFLCAEYGIPHTTQAGSYIEHYINLLENDSRALLRAASQASKAVEYIHEQTRQDAAAQVIPNLAAQPTLHATA